MCPARASAMRILIESAQLLGARELVAVESAHIDGCLYQGDSGVFFLEHLVKLGGEVAVPTMPGGGLQTSTSFIPAIKTFAAYAAFFVFGFIIIAYRHTARAVAPPFGCDPFRAAGAGYGAGDSAPAEG